MQLHHALLGILALATGSLAADDEDGCCSHMNRFRNVIYCSPDDIVNHRVSGCDCRPKQKQKTCAKWCQACSPLQTTIKYVNDCSAGCRLPSDGECECTGCGLWFHSVCDCVKDPTNPKTCHTDKAISPGSANTWVHLVNDPTEHDLISSTSIIPGILDMTAKPSPYFERAWVYAQERWDPSSQALAMNPWLVRTMEQVHIHLCPLKPNLRDALTKEVFKSDKHLVKLDNTKFNSLWCIGAKKGKVIENFVALLSEMIAQEKAKGKAGICPEMIGAGMMMDNDQRTWACATTERHGPLGFFCKK